ncbi:MAG: hypothetical protein FI707_15870 [SAR202 cluster bacterium]|nr:hypothetical protein [SAR202 cluster bacterium]MQG70255.1 hypothetical protein [SAR202 cluster bacterium]
MRRRSFSADSLPRHASTTRDIGLTTMPDALQTSQSLSVEAILAAGYPNREIASELFLSVNTVRWHTHNLFGELGIGRRSEAVAPDRNRGLL